MANLNIKTVKFNVERKFPSYIISAIIDCRFGYEGVKLINRPEELDNFYQGIVNREGYIKLLEGGASLYLTRLAKEGARNSTLRLLDNSFRYSHPENIYNIEYEDTSIISKPTISPDEVSLHGSRTYSYELDFRSSSMEDEDYIAVPSYSSSDLSYDDSTIFYFTNLDNSAESKKPNDFTPSVPLGTLGDKSMGINTSSEFNKDNRAKLIYDWYLGILPSEDIDSNGISRYELSGTPGDSNIEADLCVLDETNNKVTLVFSQPVRNIQYFRSNSLNPFTVRSNKNLNQELISISSKLDSIVSFRSKLVGDIDMSLTLKYIRNFEFELELTANFTSEYHYVTLDRDAPLYQGRSIYIEDVIDSDSEFIEASVHLGGRIYSETSDKYTEEQAKNLQGSYILSYGSGGVDLPTLVDGVIEYPFQRSLRLLSEYNKLSNLFLFEEFTNPLFQRECIQNYLYENTTVGIVNIPETETTEVGIRNYLLDDPERELVLYTYGRSELNSTLIDNSFFYALNCIEGNFKGKIIEDSIPKDVDPNVLELLESLRINTIDSNKDFHFVNEIINLESFLRPHYLMVANYVKIYLSRYLQSNLGLYPKDLENKVNIELSKVSEYSNLIDTLNVRSFTSTNNNLDLILDLNLRGLIGRSLDVIIKINK
jgi:hypothetical protein